MSGGEENSVITNCAMSETNSYIEETPSQSAAVAPLSHQSVNGPLRAEFSGSSVIDGTKITSVPVNIGNVSNLPIVFIAPTACGEGESTLSNPSAISAPYDPASVLQTLTPVPNNLPATHIEHNTLQALQANEALAMKANWPLLAPSVVSYSEGMQSYWQPCQLPLVPWNAYQPGAVLQLERPNELIVTQPVGTVHAWPSHAMVQVRPPPGFNAITTSAADEEAMVLHPPGSITYVNPKPWAPLWLTTIHPVHQLTPSVAATGVVLENPQSVLPVATIDGFLENPQPVPSNDVTDELLEDAPSSSPRPIQNLQLASQGNAARKTTNTASGLENGRCDTLTGIDDNVNSPGENYKRRKCIRRSTQEVHASSNSIIKSGEKSFRCSECDECFAEISALTRHKKAHSEKKTFPCVDCKKSFTRKSYLAVHMQLHSGERQFHCNDCGKGFVRKSILTEHMRVHTGEKPFHCVYCNKSFANKFVLKVHTRLHTGEKPYHCSYCEKSFAYSSHHTVHTRVHTREKPYICSNCNKSFAVKAALTRHYLVHTGEKVFQFHCKDCGKGFVHKYQLTVHMRIHTGEKPFHCVYCKKCFANKFYLKVHTRYHTGEKPFPCDNCEKSFVHQSDLTVHKRVHTQEKPFRCSDCDKAFAVSPALKRHIVVHTREKPFRCSYCDKCFAHRSTLVNHIRVHTR